jgi:hypothetical protein
MRARRLPAFPRFLGSTRPPGVPTVGRMSHNVQRTGWTKTSYVLRGRPLREATGHVTAVLARHLATLEGAEVSR